MYGWKCCGAPFEAHSPRLIVIATHAAALRYSCRVSTRFDELYGSPPLITADAPGRVNLIGEHTDYNDGLVLPAALPLRTKVELAARNGYQIRVWSDAFADRPPISFSLDIDQAHRDWTDYVRGMVWALREYGLEHGFDARITSTVPVGGGLSSSAALLIALGRALRQAFGLQLDDLELARLARKAETDFVGAPVGIMDQMACSLADETNALFIDTRTLACERIPLPADVEILVIDSGVRHSHASGEYRVRRDECQRAAARLGVSSLRDIQETDLRVIEALPDPLNRRARHVVTENGRVLSAIEALRSNSMAETGRLFLASHASMRDDFEVSTPVVDALVDATAATAGVYGARLTGGGFGGAIVALTERGRAIEIGNAVVARHNQRFPHHATVVVPDSRIQRFKDS
jgi:galactokinase